MEINHTHKSYINGMLKFGGVLRIELLEITPKCLIVFIFLLLLFLVGTLCYLHLSFAVFQIHPVNQMF